MFSGAPSLACIDGWAKPFAQWMMPTGGHTLLTIRYIRSCRQYDSVPNSRLMQLFDTTEEDDLHELDLSRNYLGPRGLHAALYLVKTLSHLETLDLSHNNLELEHIIALQAVAESHPALQTINLSGNPITVTAARRLAEMLLNNTRIIHIGLDDTMVDAQWCERIAKYCARNVAAAAAECSSQARGLLSKSQPCRLLGQWKYIKIYVRATQPEVIPQIELLQRTIIPKLNFMGNALSLRFIVVSFSWDFSKGVTQNIIKTSLEAIDGCRDDANHSLPWFIIFLQGSDITQAIDALPEVPSGRRSLGLETGNAASLSLFRIETSHAFLHQYGKSPPTNFVPTIFLYNCTNVESSPKSCPAREKARMNGRPADVLTPSSWMTKLKQCPVVQQRSYAPSAGGLAELEIDICNDLFGAARMLHGATQRNANPRYAPSKAIPPSPQFFTPEDPCAQVAMQQAAYIEWKATLCAAEQGQLQTLWDACTFGSTFPLLLVASSGWGKSTLLAKMCTQPADSSWKILYVFVGGSVGSIHIYDILFYVYTQLRQLMGMEIPVDGHLDGTFEELPRFFIDLLQKPPPMQIMIVIDGLDNVEYCDDSIKDGAPGVPKEASLSWIPHSFHHMIRMVLSVNNGSPALELLRQRSPHPFELRLSTVMTNDGVSSPVVKFVPPAPLHDQDVSPEAISEEHTPSVTLEEHFLEQLPSWEADFGAKPVSQVLCLLAVHKEGIPLDELEKLCSESLPNSLDDSRGLVQKIIMQISHLMYTGPSGLVQLSASTLRPIIQKHCSLDSAKVRAIWTASAQYHQQAFAQKDYRFLRALETVVSDFIHVGDLISAHKMLTDIHFMEMKVQAGLYWQLLRDYDILIRKVHAAGRFSLEFPQGKERQRPNHFRGSFKQRILVHYADTLRQNYQFLHQYPSLCQLGASLPDSHPLWQEGVRPMVINNHVPYPLLLHQNRGVCDTRSQYTLVGHSTAVIHCHFAPLGTTLLTTSRSGEIMEWNTEHGMLLRQLQPGAGETVPAAQWLAALYRPDGGGFLAIAEDELTWWDTGVDHPRTNLKGHVSSLTPDAFNPEGKTLVTVLAGQDKLQTVDVLDGSLVGRPTPLNSGHINEVVFAAAGQTVLACCDIEVKLGSPSGTAAYRLHKGPVSQITSCADGTLVATAQDNVIHVWNYTSRQPLQVLSQNSSPVTTLSFSEDGTYLISGYQDSTIQVWRLIDGAAVKVLHANQHRPVRSNRANSPTRARTNAPQGRTARPQVGWCTFTPQDRFILARVGSYVIMWDSVSYEWVDTLLGHDGYINWVDLNPVFDSIATACDDQTVRIWDLNAPSIRAKQGTSTAILQCSGVHHSSVMSLDISVDGARVCTSSVDGDLKVWRLDDAEGSLILHLAGGWSFAKFVPGGEAKHGLVALRAKSLHLMNADTGVHAYSIPIPDLEADGRAMVYALEVVPDGKSVALLMHRKGSDGIVVFSLQEGVQIAGFTHATESITNIRYLCNGNLLSYTSEGAILQWSVKDPSKQEQMVHSPSPIEATALYTDGSLLITASVDGCLQVHPTLGSTTHALLRGHTALATCAAVSCNGRFILSGAEDRTVRLWLLGTNKCAGFFICKGTPTIVAFMPPQPQTGNVGRAIAGDSSGAVYIFDIVG